ncbi:MAG: hypothetical protein M1830_003464 [Pleopsidium flavum]|nr:MAG: hypothetical protein M1830_003464 [Pleopsidium flavum]
MADWRDRGFVPDSDEEDEDASIETQGAESGLNDNDFQDIDHVLEGNSATEAESHDPSHKGQELYCDNIHRSRSKSPATAIDLSIAGPPTLISRSSSTEEATQDQSQVTPAFAAGTNDTRCHPPRTEREDDDGIDILQNDDDDATAVEQLGTELLYESRADTNNCLESHEGPERRSTSIASSSPLTELPSTPITEFFERDVSPSPIRCEVSPVRQGTETEPGLSNNLKENERVDPHRQAFAVEILTASRPARALRQRNPIQLHPYMLESERYRKFLKARGVKPLRIAQAQAEANLGDIDSQEQDFEADNHSQSPNHDHDWLIGSSPVDSANNRCHTMSPPLEVPHSPDMLADAEDFPDVDSLLRGPFPHGIRRGYKLRKISHTYGRKIPGTPQKTINTISTGIDSGKDSDTVMVDTDNVYDIPPSPPRSGSLSSHGHDPFLAGKFRFPRGQSTVRPQTPLTSSEPRRRPIIILSEDPEQGLGLGSRSSTPSPSSTRTSSPASDHTQSHQLQRAQRKIRGVLPASWLRLDLKTQAKKPEVTIERNQRSASPSRSQFHRGVGRRVSISRNQTLITSNGAINPVVISDDSDRSSGTRNSQSKDADDSTMRLSENDHGVHYGLLLGDIEEDNRISAMLPSEARRRQTGVVRKKRQARLTDGTGVPIIRHNSAHHSLFKSSYNGPSHQPRITKHLSATNASKANMSRAPRPVPPRLSVLDAPRTNSNSHIPIPQFIRVAARRARSRKDRGRHSPARKFIRLGNKADTEDAQSVLRDWRGGTIAPKPQSIRNGVENGRCRGPLNDMSGNEQRKFSSLAPSKQSERTFTPSISLASSRAPNLFKNSTKKQIVLKQTVRRRAGSQKVAPIFDSLQIPSQRRLKDTAGQKRLLSSLQKAAGPRLAQLESVESDHGPFRQRATFESNLSRLNHYSSHHTSCGPALPSLQLARFLGSEELVTAPPSLQLARDSLELGDPHGKHGRPPLRVAHRPRKQRPRRVDADALEFRQPSIPVPVHGSLSYESLPVHGDRAILYGLASFGTQYTNDFDITPLRVGTFFHESTFIGSGEFAKSLHFTSSRDLDAPAGVTVHRLEDRVLRWGAWDETVSSELSLVLDFAGRSLGNNEGQLAFRQADSAPVAMAEVVSLLRFIVRYFSQTLSFFDPIDRSSFSRRCISLLKALAEELRASHALSSQGDLADMAALRKTIIQVAACNLVLTNQIRQIASHEVVDTPISAETEALVRSNARDIVSMVHGSEFQVLRKFLEDNRYHTKREAGIREDDAALEALVITDHVLQQANLSDASFWDFLQRQMLQLSIEKIHDVQTLERVWYDLFTLLPLVEFDESGFLEVGRRFRCSAEGWTVVKGLVSAVLDIYLTNAEKQNATFNSYCRALFNRCLLLIKGWGWRKCEVIIGTLFDFFARNNLAHLRYEESRGSPRFLQDLDKDPSLDPDPDDRCFHILLKIIATGLKAMRHVYPDKKVRNIAWRLMPNHGRLHPKDKAVRQEDLDALRNHHDLLCTIYWASPAGFRPRLDVIRNLVHPGSSHREACHISIRAWSNLFRFQLSTHEPLVCLKPFTVWHEYLTEQMLSQHSLARGEAESQVASAAGNLIISTELLESTIAKNQRQVEAVLSDALVSLKNGLSATRSAVIAKTLFSKVSTAEIFNLFDVKQPRVNTIVLQALDVVLEYARLCKDRDTPETIQQASEDSQAYGDWSAFEDVVEADPKDEAIEHLHSTVHDALARLLSNCFGADETVDDAILLKVVDTWTSVAHPFVSKGLKQWSNYVGLYSTESWTSLRGTEPTRKYTAYFMSRVIEEDPNSYEENKTVFLQCWVSGLVERESLLKFQHKLTSALLNVDPNNELLANLPFSVNPRERCYRLSATDFKYRRLSLISSFLSNMRHSLSEAMSCDNGRYPRLRQEYRELLKYLMNSMRGNYQELGHGTSVRGAYVDFVHRVVEFLQQHTSDICQIDKFFTDSSAFPLPATDPAYVVGRLKSYGLRLADSRTPKQLVAFVQTVTERAAVDNQQAYLVEQLHTAMSDVFEGGDASKPTLRAFLIETVFPAYIASAFNTSTGWLLVNPILQAVQRMYRRISEDLDGTDIASIESFISMTTNFLDTMRQTLELLVDHSRLLEQPSILNMLADFMSTATAILPSLNYIHRLSRKATHAAQCIDFIKSFALFVAAHLLAHDDVRSPYSDAPDFPPLNLRYPEIRQFVANELQKTLSSNWVFHEGQYYVLRGNVRKEINVHIGSLEEERVGVITAIEGFFAVLVRMHGLNNWGPDRGAETSSISRHGLGSSDVFV